MKSVELCGKMVTYLVAGASWFPCALLKGHDGDCRAAGNCSKHGEYLGEPLKVPQCPKWPDCVADAPAESKPAAGQAQDAVPEYPHDHPVVQAIERGWRKWEEASCTDPGCGCVTVWIWRELVKDGLVEAAARAAQGGAPDNERS